MTDEAMLDRSMCVSCQRWTPGPVVVRGDTQGWCAAFTTNTAAGFGCDVHIQLIPVLDEGA
jgi:hypothetical protein